MATKLANRREKKLVLQQLNAHILGIKGVKANIHTGKGGALEKCETLSGTCHYEKRSSDVRSLHVQPSKRLNGNRAYSNIHEVPPFHLMHTCRNTCTHTCTHTHTHTQIMHPLAYTYTLKNRSRSFVCELTCHDALPLAQSVPAVQSISPSLSATHLVTRIGEEQGNDVQLANHLDVSCSRPPTDNLAKIGAGPVNLENLQPFEPRSRQDAPLT